MKYFSPQEFKTALKSGDQGECTIRKAAFGAPEATDDDRCIKFTISTDAVDRDDDKINQKGWKLDNFKANPVVLWAHKGSEPPIGKVVGIGIENGDLKATVEFVPADNSFVGAKAEGVYQMCKSGFISAVSVGFSPIDWDLTDDKARGGGGWNPGVDFKAQELFELSIVPIPANPEALIEPNQTISPPKHLTAEVLNDFTQQLAQKLNNERARRARIVRLLELY